MLEQAAQRDGRDCVPPGNRKLSVEDRQPIISFRVCQPQLERDRE
jgi:hypothetical protein